MKKYLFLIVLLIGVSVLTISCSKENSDEEPAQEIEFVPGEIIVVFHDATSFVAAYDLVDSLEFEISSLRNFGYQVKTVEDSLPIIGSLLLAKPYLNHELQSNAITYSPPFVQSNLYFEDLNSKDVIDWFGFVDEIGFEEIPNRIAGVYKWSVLFVPEGTEAYWASFLNTHPLVSSSTVNSLTQIF